MADAQRDSAESICSELVREDPSFADIVEEFLLGLPQRLEQLETAVAEADFAGLRRCAHQLKGSGSGYGYPALTDLAARVEHDALAGRIEACTSGVTELKDMISRLVVSPE